jgi:hypothetical protein
MTLVSVHKPKPHEHRIPTGRPDGATEVPAAAGATEEPEDAGVAEAPAEAVAEAPAQPVTTAPTPSAEPAVEAAPAGE